MRDSKKWLVSCCNALGGLFKVDPNTEEYEKLLDEDCRGIARYKDHYVLATTSSGLILLDNKFHVISTDRTTSLDYHGVAVVKNLAYVVETHRNAIGIYRLPDFKKIQDMQLFPLEGDVLHMNDLFIQRDRLFVSMFSLDGPWQLQTEKPSGGIMEFSVATKQLVQVHFPHTVHHPHSVRLYKGKLLYCSSYPGEVKHGDKVVFRTSGYARGLYRGAKQMGIGNSQSRRKNEKQQQAGIYIYSGAEEPTRFIALPALEVYGIL